MHDIAIVGGGLAGLINSILLSRAGLSVILFEKKQYPFHRVCGEYISNEVLPFLEKHDLFPSALSPADINKLTITSAGGSSFHTPLDLGGFGISRYAYDHWLANTARQSGVQVMENTTVRQVNHHQDHFTIDTTDDLQHHCHLVIGAHGKRAKLDQQLRREFMQAHSPYVGVKYHLKGDFAPDTISLHNFRGGYCGLSKVEGDMFNLCYLIHRDMVRQYGNLEQTERQLLSKNPHLHEVFRNATFLFDKPEVVNEISFRPKEAVHQDILMSGDAAGMVTPLCGNGMAMAIRSASILTTTILENQSSGVFDRSAIHAQYEEQWNQLFNKRIWIGRQIQKAYFGSPFTSRLAVLTGRTLKSLTRALIRQTHGEPFD